MESEKQEKLLKHRVVEVIAGNDLQKKLAVGKKLRIKLGADPTAPDLHLGHAIALKKLREFQELGHQIVLIIGDYTARVGDPSGKSKTRPQLSAEEIEFNAQTYLDQVGKILDMNKVEIRRNSEWFAKMDFNGILKLTAQFTVARMIERDDFSNRLKSGTDIHMHELLYPMMQAYDSVMIEADVEIGGTDQKFNMLAGRELQKKMGLVPQDVMIIGPILVGLDGIKKMSKSLDNYIGISESADSMYGKIMSIPDSLLWDYFYLATEVGEQEVDNLKRSDANPRDIKMRLAREIVTFYHNAESAQKSEEQFLKVFSNKELPDIIEEREMKKGEIGLVELLTEVGFATSKGDARRVIEQGGVKLNNEVETDINKILDLGSEAVLIQKGKRNFVKIKGI